MRERAQAMIKVDSVLRMLSSEDQSAVAFEVYRTYFTGQGVHKESTKQGEVNGTNGQLHQYVVSSEASEAASKNRQLLETAREVLQFLNEKSGRHFRFVDINLSFIKVVLKSGATLDDCKGVVARKVRQWKGTEMEKDLRPATLFNKTKFEQYLGEQGT